MQTTTWIWRDENWLNLNSIHLTHGNARKISNHQSVVSRQSLETLKRYGWIEKKQGCRRKNPPVLVHQTRAQRPLRRGSTGHTSWSHTLEHRDTATLKFNSQLPFEAKSKAPRVAHTKQTLIQKDQWKIRWENILHLLWILRGGSRILRKRGPVTEIGIVAQFWN